MRKPERSGGMTPEQRGKLYRCKFTVFFSVFFLMFLIALIIPLRPTVSEIEKRELAKFPSFSFKTLFSGEFFDDVDLWFSDTFPCRELFLNGNNKMKQLYGIQTISIHGEVESGDEIPDEPLKPEESTTAPQGGSADTPEETTTEPTQTTTEEETTAANPYEDVSTETINAMLCAGNSGFEYYNFNRKVADRYISAVNQTTSRLNGKANVYDMIVPTSMDIILPESKREGLNTDDQHKAINYFYGSVRAKTIDIFDKLLSHNSEYIYFRTDHHWTALGAYYAYEEFAKAKGFTPTPLSAFETREFSDFLGSFYAESDKNPKLGETPDTVTAYVPKDTNDMIYKDKNGNKINSKIISDVTTWNKNSKYLTFICGDNPYSVIENPNITDGSSIVVVKESFGNAFVPFLVGHYQNVYVIDYRYWKGNLADFTIQNNVDDVLFINNISATRSSSLVEKMEKIT